MATIATAPQDTGTGSAVRALEGATELAEALTGSTTSAAATGAAAALPTVSGSPDKAYTFSCRVQYSSEEDATMVQKALSVDPELRPKLVTRKLGVSGSALVMDFAAVDARTLRSAVGTFCDLLALATRTLEAFDKVER